MIDSGELPARANAPGITNASASILIVDDDTPPVVITHPLSQLIVVSNAVSFNVAATGQAKLFPPTVRESGVLRIPVLLVVAGLLYSLVRVRVWPRLRRWRVARPAHGVR